MKESISSSMTFFYKFIFSSLWIAGFGLGTISTMSLHDRETTIFVIMFVLGTLFIYWGCIRLKKVRLDEEFVYISNFRKEIRVHRSEISRVTENVFVNIHPVWIHFRRTTDFGDYIMFMPGVRLFSFFSSHPVVKELRKKVEPR
jgi:hypothetical protein